MTGVPPSRRLGRAVAEAARELYGLVVEDGFVAIGALAAIAVCGLLTREGLLGPSLLAGIALFVLLAASLLGSLRREVKGRRRRPEHHP